MHGARMHGSTTCIWRMWSSPSIKFLQHQTIFPQQTLNLDGSRVDGFYRSFFLHRCILSSMTKIGFHSGQSGINRLRSQRSRGLVCSIHRILLMLVRLPSKCRGLSQENHQDQGHGLLFTGTTRRRSPIDIWGTVEFILKISIWVRKVFGQWTHFWLGGCAHILKG